MSASGSSGGTGRTAPASRVRRTGSPAAARTTGRPTAQQSNSFEGTNFDSSGWAPSETKRGVGGPQVAGGNLGLDQAVEGDRALREAGCLLFEPLAHGAVPYQQELEAVAEPAGRLHGGAQPLGDAQVPGVGPDETVLGQP